VAEPLRLLSVGSLSWTQGYEHALTAVKLLRDRGIACEYRIVGHGPHHDAVAFARHQLGLDDCVELHDGSASEGLRDHLSWACAVIDASVVAGSPRGVRDAQAAGVPVVTTGMSDGLDGSALTVPARDPEALCEALALLAGDAQPRFAFGENWLRFLERVDDARLGAAETSLRKALRVDDLAGVSFLDAGSGSGLFSLAAVRLGAARVHSFDFDPDSVACTERIRELHALTCERWTVERGDLTDQGYCASLGSFDAVYCFGVVHHTGAMWTALDNLVGTVAPGGLLYLSVYNHQGRASARWMRVKRLYNRLPARLRPLYAGVVWLPFEAREAASTAIRDPRAYLRTWTDRDRGMSRWHDIVDWIGGYPFEVAKPDEVFDRCRRHGLELVALATVGGSLACNEFLFRRAPAP
jgi:SAM-dependent methyltransferase